MLYMKNWEICAPPGFSVGFEGDNNATTLAIRTDLDEGWSLKVDVEKDGKSNIVALHRAGDIYSAVLTSSMLAEDGRYRMQVRGTLGDQIRHSNIFYAVVYESINAVDQFPPALPSEFEQLEAQVTADAARAEAARKAIENLEAEGVTLEPDQLVDVDKAVSPDGAVTLTFRIPKGQPGEKGDTGARGETGLQGPQGVQGQPGRSGLLPVVRTEAAAAELTPNTCTVLDGELPALALTLLPPDTEETDTEWRAIFQAGEGFQLSDTAPEGYALRWDADPVWQAGTVYEVSYGNEFLTGADGKIIIGVLWRAWT